MELYRRSIVIDATVPLAPISAADVAYAPDELVHAYTTAGVTAAVFTVVDDYPHSVEQTVKLLARNRRYFLNRPDECILIDSPDDIMRAKASGKLAAGFAFQGSSALMGDLSMVETYRRLGVLQMLLAYNAGNMAADGCHETRNAGLTQFGRELIAEMNRVGIILDLSHVGERSSLEALELTTRPPVFSHSTPRHFAPHQRNITDEQIRACAAHDGVVCLTGVGLFMDSDNARATAPRLVDTIEYVAQLVGPRHAGIGLDYVLDATWMARFINSHSSLYGGATQYPGNGLIEFASPGILGDVADLLMQRGYSDSDVADVLGTNYLRVLTANFGRVNG